MSGQQQKRESAAGAISGLETDPQKLQAVIDELRAQLWKEEGRHNEELRQFAYVVSHDLREPLRMIASYSQLLIRRFTSQLDDDGREFLGVIVESVRRMEKLLSDLVSYSHYFQPPEPPPAEIDPEVVLEGVLLMIEKEVRESNAKVVYDPLPKITFDFTRLTQLFKQLITNSIRFRGAEPPRIHIAASETDQETVFSIRDNGVGIDPRYHEQIFGVFRRLQAGDSTSTGIGLAICKRIVEQQGGRIWVDSEAGRGATFCFSVTR